jgi:uncharacterized repeat protein (TIGR01451 family)
VVAARTSEGSCQRGNPLRCSLGTIAAGDRVTVTTVVRFRKAGRRKRNTATATADGTDANPSNNRDAATVRVRKIRLRLSKVASTPMAAPGESFAYRIRVRNPSRGVARRVRVCDTLPGAVAYRSSTPKVQPDADDRLCWTIKRLGPREHRDYRVRVRATSSPTDGPILNRVTARSPDTFAASALSRVRVRRVTPRFTG